MAFVRSEKANRFSYHVFLSFRGEDTRKTFTDHLYAALVQAGFRTFRDDDEIRRGENIKSELEKAIQQSRMFIIVLSKEYASSRWCLDELFMILECRRTFGSVVIPIFYDVDPSDVRNQTGSFAAAFDKHEKLFKAETNGELKNGWMGKVGGWRAALREVADLGGMALQNQADGHEAKFIQKIVKVIRDKVNHSGLDVGRYLVGIHSRVKNVNIWLQDGLANVDILVICGMGGIGKTTIAKFVYNMNSQLFERSIFLSNIREVSQQSNGLLTLQRQLLSSLLKGKKEKIYNLEEGTNKIRDAICCNRVFIVLDDVVDVNQLHMLLGTREFYPGSKIIITTRRRWLLKAHEVHKLHMVEKLDDHESLKLFCLNAFGEDHCKEGYMDHLVRIVQHCGGLPLALQVLGCSLSGRNLNVWESALRKLEAIPEAKILEKLKLSYDSLQDDHDKNLFLHIACFFVGEDVDYTIYILDKCDFFTKVGIQNLIDRCLLIVDMNKLMMHQSLQEMGREIVRQESPQEPGKRTRLWHHVDSYNIVREMTATKAIEGLVLDMHMFNEDNSAKLSYNVNFPKKRRYEDYIDNSFLSNKISSEQCRFGLFSLQSVNKVSRGQGGVELSTSAFSRMERLRLLQLKYVQLTGCYKNFPTNLRWLSWHGFPLKYIPTDLPLSNVVALDMRYSKLEQVWEKTMLLVSLKILDLSHSQGLSRTPDFSGLPNLERLVLKGCVSLLYVCNSIIYLERLTLLDLEDCKKLVKLPTDIHLLKSLETLVISGCSNLAEFQMEGTTRDTSLISKREVKPWCAFVWSWMSKPTKSPEIIRLSLPLSLVSLSLADCNLTEDSFPRDFNKLSLLCNLDIGKNLIKSLPDCIKTLSRLQRLDVESCDRLQSILDLPSSLQNLWLNNSKSVKKITFESTPCKLVYIGSIGCQNLHEVSGFFKLEPIEKVDRETRRDLGLFDVESLRNLVVILESSFMGYPAKLPVQGLHEFGIFNTFLPTSEVPSWFIDKNRRLSSSFTVPSLPCNHHIRGLNICSVYEFFGQIYHWVPHPAFTKINNKTKNLTWIYCPMYFGIPHGEEDLAWLSHWKFGNQLESGDEISVTVIMGEPFHIKEYGINLVYGEDEDNVPAEVDEKETITQENSIYVSSEVVIGGDLTKYKLSTGAYFLGRNPFFSGCGAHDFTKTDWFQNVFGDNITYEEVYQWTWNGRYNY